MKNVLYLIVFTLISFTSMGAVIDFSGTWNLNKSKSTLNDQFSMAPSKMILAQTAEVLEMEKHGSFQEQDFTTNEKFTLDGKASINKGWQDSEKSSTIVWSEDGKMMTITSKIPMQDGGEMVITEAYQMDGDLLKVVMNASSSFGDLSETQFFDKQ